MVALTFSLVTFWTDITCIVLSPNIAMSDHTLHSIRTFPSHVEPSRVQFWFLQLEKEICINLLLFISLRFLYMSESIERFVHWGSTLWEDWSSNNPWECEVSRDCLERFGWSLVVLLVFFYSFYQLLEWDRLFPTMQLPLELLKILPSLMASLILPE